MENAIKRKNTNFFEITKISQFLYGVYRVLILPFLKAISPIESQCRFYPSCGQYSKDAFEVFSFWQAFLLSGKRLSKCHPFYHGENLDPLPVEKSKNV